MSYGYHRTRKASLSLRQLLEERVDKDGPLPPHRPELDQCWPACPARGGPPGPNYAEIWVPAEQRTRSAHSIAWELAYGNHPCMRGPRLGHIQVLHRCDNRPCARPSHLFLGTMSDNIKDMHAKGRAADFNGANCGAAKLTVDIVGTIRSRRAAGDSLRTLGQTYGISSGHISQIVSRQIWRNVP